MNRFSIANTVTKFNWNWTNIQGIKQTRLVNKIIKLKKKEERDNRGKKNRNHKKWRAE